jgi:hypothetical protein
MFLLAFSSVIAVLSVLGGFGFVEEYHAVAIPFLLKAAILYFLLDSYDCKTDFRIHHVFAVILFGCILNNPSSELAASVIMMACKLEISTLFLNAYTLFPNVKSLKYLFMPSFFYFRIYLFYRFFPENFHIQDEMYHAYFASLMGLFVVQLYWAGLMVKKIVGDSFAGEQYIAIYHAVTSVTYILAIYSDYASGGATKGSLTVHTIIAATSFAYYSYPTSKTCFVADSIAIHLLMSYRSWRLMPKGIEMQVIFNLIILYYRTNLFCPNDNNLEVFLLPALVTAFDYIQLLFNTPHGLCSPLIWEYSVQLLLMFLSQYMNWFNDFSFIFAHVLFIANANTFGRIFLSAGV